MKIQVIYYLAQFDEVISQWNIAQIHSEIKHLIRVKLDVKPLAKTIH